METFCKQALFYWECSATWDNETKPLKQNGHNEWNHWNRQNEQNKTTSQNHQNKQNIKWYLMSLLRANSKNANLSVIQAGRSVIQANLQSAIQANQSANRLWAFRLLLHLAWKVIRLAWVMLRWACLWLKIVSTHDLSSEKLVKEKTIVEIWLNQKAVGSKAKDKSPKQTLVFVTTYYISAKP